MGEGGFVHVAPVWRDRADFIIGARVTQDEPGQRTWEQLWARRLSEDRFELCCIPFFTYDLALGDHVETGVEGSLRYMVRRVVERSGHYTFRVWFGDSNYRRAREELPGEAEQMGCLWEWSSENLLAISAPGDVEGRAIQDELIRRQELGHLVYEAGWTDA